MLRNREEKTDGRDMIVIVNWFGCRGEGKNEESLMTWSF